VPDDPAARPAAASDALGRLTAADTSWMTTAHWIGLATHWVGPLLVLLTVGQRRPRVRAEAVESLNWEITVAVGLAVAMLLMPTGLGWPAALLVVLCSIGFHLRGAAVASEGRPFHYPVALRLVR
jgi:uncharacterized Tic20 family protein